MGRSERRTINEPAPTSVPPPGLTSRDPNGQCGLSRDHPQDTGAPPWLKVSVQPRSRFPLAERVGNLESRTLDRNIPQNSQPQAVYTAPLHQLVESLNQPGRDRDAIDANTTRVPASPGVMTLPSSSENASVAAEPVGESVPFQHSRLSPHRKPAIKILLHGTTGKHEHTLKDLENACLDNIKDLDPNNIRVNTYVGGETMNVEEDFRWFFDSHGIVPGDTLILLVAGRGHLHRDGSVVKLNLYTPYGEQMDTRALHTEISKLPQYCTLEVVLGTCHVEGVGQAIGLSGCADHEALSATPPPPHIAITATAMLTRIINLNPFFAWRESTETNLNLLNTQANVVVWAVTDTDQQAPTDVLLLGQEGRLCALFGAMLQALSLHGPNTPRRVIRGYVHDSLQQEFEARVDHTEKNRSRLPGVAPRLHVRMPVFQTQIMPTPPIVLLLSSDDNSKRVLDSHIFQPLDLPSSKLTMRGRSENAITNAS